MKSPITRTLSAVVATIAPASTAMAQQGPTYPIIGAKGGAGAL